MTFFQQDGTNGFMKNNRTVHEFFDEDLALVDKCNDLFKPDFSLYVI